jgi:molybdate-binding protein
MCTAADALEMDFLPLFEERCDLIVLEVFYNHQLSAPLCSVIKGDEFQEALDALTG